MVAQSTTEADADLEPLIEQGHALVRWFTAQKKIRLMEARGSESLTVY